LPHELTIEDEVKRSQGKNNLCDTQETETVPGNPFPPANNPSGGKEQHGSLDNDSQAYSGEDLKVNI